MTRSVDFQINMGPQHPSTHGVLRLVLGVEGERIVTIDPVLGYLHRGVEKLSEHLRYHQVITLTDRLDYLSANANNLGYCLAVEKLLGIEAPERAMHLRVIMAELTRIASHLVWLGSHAIDLGAMTMIMYAFREREKILDLFELAAGARMTTSYLRVGGVSRDVGEPFLSGVKVFTADLPGHLREYDALLRENRIFLGRTRGVGVLAPATALAYGVTGPALRGSGVAYDVRKARPYSGYDRFTFDVPLGTVGDVYDRYLVRREELGQSLRIIDQAVRTLPGGPVLVDNPKIARPPRDLIEQDIESLIHHFLLAEEGFAPPPGEVYQSVEAPKGELGFFIVSDGSPTPYRLRIRTPSFANLSVLPELARGAAIADIVAIIGSIDIVLGEIDR